MAGSRMNGVGFVESDDRSERNRSSPCAQPSERAALGDHCGACGRIRAQPRARSHSNSEWSAREQVRSAGRCSPRSKSYLLLRKRPYGATTVLILARARKELGQLLSTWYALPPAAGRHSLRERPQLGQGRTPPTRVLGVSIQTWEAFHAGSRLRSSSASSPVILATSLCAGHRVDLRGGRSSAPPCGDLRSISEGITGRD